MAGKRVVYWDACIFIAWLRDEPRPDIADIDGIAYLVEEWDARQLVIVTSAITRIEVLDSKLTSEQASRFKACLRRSNMRVESVTTPIADLAHMIRDFYSAPRLATPDAIHLASAIAADCSTFFTFDGVDTKDKKTRKLLSLGPVIAGKYQLVTDRPRRPVVSQGEFPLMLPKKV